MSDIGNNFHFYIPLDDAHTMLARACLTVLLQLDDTTDKGRLASSPLAFYAADHWASHIKFRDVASRCHGAFIRSKNAIFCILDLDTRLAREGTTSHEYPRITPITT